jgi:hypothetical protein
MIIFKYPLLPKEHQVLTLPHGAKILSVVEQNEKICVYAKVDLNEPHMGDYDFWVVPTGQEIPYEDINAIFLGTVKLHGGALIFHVFYE